MNSQADSTLSNGSRTLTEKKINRGKFIRLLRTFINAVIQV